MKPSARESVLPVGIDERTERTLGLLGSFYDACKVGYQGNKGYRKSTDLGRLAPCIRELYYEGYLRPDRTVFADLGCADGRVNVMMSYFVRSSIGIEIDPDILAEYAPRREALTSMLMEAGLDPPRDNVYLFQGNSLGPTVYRRIHERIGLTFQDVDLFYTYITLHDAFAEKIARDACPGALYLVYGFHKVLPCYPGLEVVIPDVGGQRIAALFAKRRGA